ncbi:unnamed protein product [Callosobruchus maculatus]|uniref:SAM domain-containing protein n=1 Tax=Callosobruchus maculatus TaxID=64391 RepID=A0A653D2R6_CALMS|nr:unnamed protein product [Callosobruchus maculatus]
MAFEYTNLLINWGLSAYVQKFIEEGIDDLSFVLLDDDAINGIFDKCGPKLIFKAKYKAYIEGQTIQQEPINIDPEPSCSYTGSDNSSTTWIELVNTPTPELEDSCKTPQQEEKRIKLNLHESCFSESLESIMLKSSDGRLALNNKHKLNNDLRGKIAKIVINELLNLRGHKFELQKQDFMNGARDIVNLFPGEDIDTYYIPYLKGSPNTRHPARGKLWVRYLNVRAALRVGKQQKPTCLQNLEVNEETKNALIFLKNAVEPYTKIVKAWETTTVIRKNFGECRITKLFEEFPCLRMPFDIDLFELDFRYYYEDKIDIIYHQWPKVSNAIIEEAKQRNIRGADDSHLENSLHALLLLPFLFSSITIRRSNKEKQTWRPTRTEVQESFFVYIQRFDMLNAILERRLAKLEAHKLHLQPFGAAVGANLEDIDNYYIVISKDIVYKCDTSIWCLELLFKLFHALNLEYPPECKNLWVSIQELVFDMPAGSGKNSSTAVVISDIGYHLHN